MTQYELSEMFGAAKSRLDIKECAEYYGMNIERGGRGVCPFHDDRHPSLSFKDGFFKCFACGEGGDVFKLVGKLTGVDKPIEVLRLLNRDFALDLPLDVKHSAKQAKEIRQKAREREHYKSLDKRFDEWSEHAFRVCCRYTKLLREWRANLAPNSPQEGYDPLFVESLQKLDYMEYVMDELVTADRATMKRFYVTHREEIKRIEQRIENYENEQ